MKPDRLHDPLLAGVPQPPTSAHFDARLAVLAALALLLLGFWARLRRTPRVHPDYAARADMTRLLAVIWGGLAVEWVRSRLDEFTPGFWFASCALLPFVVGAIALSLRLFRAYRASERLTPDPPPPVPLPSSLPIVPPRTKGGKP